MIFFMLFFVFILITFSILTPVDPLDARRPTLRIYDSNLIPTFAGSADNSQVSSADRFTAEYDFDADDFVTSRTLQHFSINTGFKGIIIFLEDKIIKGFHLTVV